MAFTLLRLRSATSGQTIASEAYHANCSATFKTDYTCRKEHQARLGKGQGVERIERAFVRVMSFAGSGETGEGRIGQKARRVRQDLLHLVNKVATDDGIDKQNRGSYGAVPGSRAVFRLRFVGGNKNAS